MAFWLMVTLFIIAQNLQVGLYGVVFQRIGVEQSAAGQIITAFKDPIFLGSLVFLSIATAILRLGLFPSVGIARTHVITSAAVVLSFAVLSVVFGESQKATQYLGAGRCAVGILLLAD